MWKYVLVVFLAIMAQRAYRLRKFLDSEDLTYNDESCVLKGESLGNEDMALGKHSTLFFAASGSLFACFRNGSSKAGPGGVWMMDLKKKDAQPIQIKINNYPHNQFHGHGIYVSNKTDRLYVVNHLGSESVVDVMKIAYNPVKVTHLKTVKSELFPRYGINDVVEGIDENEIYVTRWQIFSFPENGLSHPSSFAEQMKPILKSALYFLGIPLTMVYRCDLTKNQCEEASEKLMMANGITASQDRSFIYVADPVARTINVFRRESSGQLKLEEVVDIPHSADNLEIDHQTGEILMGTLPDLVSAIKSEGGNKDVTVPGGYAAMKKSKEGKWEISNILLHDGKKMSQVSGGARFGNRIFLGSPYSKGILECRV